VSLTKSQLESHYRALESSLYNFALRWVFDPGVAQELVHDAFVRIWDRRDTVHSDTFKGLAYKTVQNLAINEIRRRKWREALSPAHWFADESAGADEKMIARQDLREMKQLLEQMPADLKEVVLLSQFSDLSYKEIADTLGIAEGTVASRKNRGLEWLREKMKGKV
jgi:RNA polymerase sigma factor (sigma-70 family)